MTCAIRCQGQHRETCCRCRVTLRNEIESCLRSLQKVEPCSTFRKGFCNLSRNVFGCCRVCYIGQRFGRFVSQWHCEASCTTNRTEQQRLTNLGPVSRKLRKLFGTEKLFVRLLLAYSIRLHGLFISCNGNKT